MIDEATNRGRSKIPLRKPTGLYVHSSPPTKVPVHPSIIRQWLRGGEIARLQDLVLLGQGGALVGEYSPHSKARAFIHLLPGVLKRIEEIHSAARDGRIERLQELLRREPKLNLELSRDSSGLGLLHKAVLRGNVPLQEWLVQHYPQTIHVLDKVKRTPLHYAGGSEDAWNRLTKAGADVNILDQLGNPPAYYMLHPRRLRPPAPETRASGKKSDRQGLVIKPSNLRIWIHDKDLGRLQKVIWEGMGNKLITETSSQPVVKRFLNAVPYIMGSIREVHSAAVNNDVELLKSKTADPVPKDILLSKDANGLSPLHKAAGLGHVEVAKEIIRRIPSAVNAKDHLDRTPLHYAAGLKESTMYQLLVDSNASDHLEDKKGNTPSHYKSKPADLESSRLLNVIPDAPRTAHIFPPSWDWRLLNQEGQTNDPAEAADDSQSDSAITQSKKYDIKIPGFPTRHYVNDARPETSEDEGVGSEKPASVGDTLSPHSDLNEEDENLREEMMPSPNLPSLGELEGSDQLESNSYNRNPPTIEESDQDTPAFCGTTALGETVSLDSIRELAEDADMLPNEEVPSSIDGDRDLHGNGAAARELRGPEKEPNLEYINDFIQAERAHLTDSVYDDRFETFRDEGNSSTSAIPQMEHKSRGNIESRGSKEQSAEFNESELSHGGYPENENPPDGPQHEYTNDFIREERAHQTDSVRIDSGLVERNTQPINLDSLDGARAEVLAITGARMEHTRKEESIDDEGQALDLRQKAAQSEISASDRKIAEQIVKSGDMEAMAEMVLNGQGMALTNVKSDNPDIQLFISNIPQYIAKIEKVHKAAREGDLRGVQTALDRRKFAVSRDNSTPLRPTPLHVAALFGRTSVLRYLAGRFPETMHAQDSEGRTPLHYAATLPDNGHFYSLLITLGADKSITDNNGTTAERYLKEKGLSREELLAEYQNRPVPIDTEGLNFNRFSDKVDNDVYSSRQDIDDDSLIELIDECYRVLRRNGSATLLGDTLSQEIFDKIRLRSTRRNHCLADVIRPGVQALALGQSRPVNFVGIIAPDYESYRVFEELFNPVIRAINSYDVLPDHPEEDFFGNENEEYFEMLDLNNQGTFVKKFVAELTRNLGPLSFPRNLRTVELENVEVALSTVLTVYYRRHREQAFTDESGDNVGSYYTLPEILENREVYQDLEEENLLTEGINLSDSSTWPYGRGTFISPFGDITAWINIRDHLKLLCVTPSGKRGRVGVAYKTLADVARLFSDKVNWARHETLGFLTTDVRQVGTGLQFSLLIHLPQLTRQRQMLASKCSELKLHSIATSHPSRVWLKSRICLGVTEIESFRSFVRSVLELIRTEKRLNKAKSLVSVPTSLRKMLAKKKVLPAPK